MACTSSRANEGSRIWAYQPPNRGPTPVRVRHAKARGGGVPTIGQRQSKRTRNGPDPSQKPRKWANLYKNTRVRRHIAGGSSNMQKLMLFGASCLLQAITTRKCELMVPLAFVHRYSIQRFLYPLLSLEPKRADPLQSSFTRLLRLKGNASAVTLVRLIQVSLASQLV